jgi:hypothetical protein
VTATRTAIDEVAIAGGITADLPAVQKREQPGYGVHV